MVDGASFLSQGAAALIGSVRIGVLFVATPVFGGIPIPALAKIVLILTLAVALIFGVGFVPVAVPGDPFQLLAAILSEAFLGAMIAAGLFAGFAAFQFAGRLLDFQIGFGVANLVDIATKSSAPLLGTALYMVASLVFFASNGHLGLLKILSFSYAAFPPGAGFHALDPALVATQFGTCFSFGLMLVAPVVLSLFVVDLGMALMSRTMPQMNVFVMSLAIKVLVGLGVFALSVPFAGGLIERVFESMFDFWLEVVR